MEQKPKILLVDDTPANLMVLGEELQETCEVFVATSGEAALEVVDREGPDLILLDIMMSGIDGYEVCRRLKDNPATASIPIIFITAMDANDEETRGLEAGAVDYITKPFHLPIVRARVRTHLDLKRKTDLLENLAGRDGLTGLFNRRKLAEMTDIAWRRTARRDGVLAIIMLDIDFFKPFNDNHGHLAGDEALRQVAAAVERAVPGTDAGGAGDAFVARYGGEEFVAVLPDTTREAAIQAAESIRAAVHAIRIPHGHSTISDHITISVGVAIEAPRIEGEHDADGYRQLLQQADEALYRAKAAGRDRVMFQHEGAAS